MPAVCGNGKLEMGEQCEDGNLAPNDGCSPTCKLEGGAYDVCPTGVIVQLDEKIAIADTTNGHKTGITLGCGLSNGPGVVYEVMPKSTGTVTVSVNVGGGNGYMAVRSSCDESGTTFDCKNAQPDATIMVAATKGVPFYVALRGKGGGKIDFTLTISY
jgi:cysteine-rich repeat protein